MSTKDTKALLENIIRDCKIISKHSNSEACLSFFAGDINILSKVLLSDINAK